MQSRLYFLKSHFLFHVVLEHWEEVVHNRFVRLLLHFFTVTKNIAQWNKKIKKRFKVHPNLFLKRVVQDIFLMKTETNYFYFKEIRRDSKRTFSYKV